MVDELAADYSDLPALFIEQDVDNILGAREERWWAGYGSSGTVYLPIAMVDSGHYVSQGSLDYYDDFSAMVDAALLRSPGARLEVERELEGNVLSLRVELTNLSGMELESARGATVYAMVYSDPGKGATQRVVKAVDSTPIPSLADGASGSYELQVPLSNSSWGQLPVVVFAEHQPSGSSGAWDMLQAVIVP